MTPVDPDAARPDPGTESVAPMERTLPPDPRPVRWLSSAEVGIAGALFVLTFGGVMYQVLGRYFPPIAWVGAGEVARLSMVAMSFILAGYLVGKNGHIVIEVFDGVLSGKKLFTVLRVVASAVMVLTCGALAWEAFLTIESGWSRLTTVMHMPLAVLYIFALVGFASGLFHSIVKIRYANRPERRLDVSEMEG